MHLLDLLDSHPALSQAAPLLQTPLSVVFGGAPSASWATLAASLQRRLNRTVLLVAPNNELAETCLNDFRALYDQDSPDCPDALIFPASDRAGLDEATGDSRATQERLAALDALHGAKPALVVTSASALAHPTLPPDDLRHGYDQIVQGQTLDRDQFLEHLSSTGYERADEVTTPGQFASRGGLVDFFPPATGVPLRVELFGDEVDSLREFDVETQRSTQKIQSIRLTPPREVYLTKAKGEEVAAQLEKLLRRQTARLRDKSEDEAAEALQERVSRDIERLRDAAYFPGLARYAPLLSPEMPSLLEHLAPDAVVVWADPTRCASALGRLVEEDASVREAQVEGGAELPLPRSPLIDFDELQARCEHLARVALHVSPEAPGATDLDIHLPPIFGGKLDLLCEHIAGIQRRRGTVAISTSHARRVREILADGGLIGVHLLDALDEAQPGLVVLMAERLTAGFSSAWEPLPPAPAPERRGGEASNGSLLELSNPLLSDSPPLPTGPGAGGRGSFTEQLLILTDAEMFGYRALQPRSVSRKRKKTGEAKPRKFSEQSSPLAALSDLKAGDFVVHIAHGIARYGGTMRQNIGGAEGDYLLLEYEGQDKLYVPAAQLDRVQKYLGADAQVPPLSSLKNNQWERTRKRVREETMQIAKQLAELYAARERAEKDPVAPDTPWQREMEAAFPYEETASQLQAIKDTKRDLETPTPMDRLVCGDVGFGKTEVAIRAAFKVVQDSKQVAVLVPTTVLAQQHYQTFSERMSAYPIRVEVISRFRTPGEQKRIVEDVKLGAVDILIGTHRLVQSDVHFKDLGLVIVDEEQRFGVMQKERLKELRKEVDILTLSATPIPRTLHQAMGGLREISLITDPPIGRLPVKTVVSPYKDEVVRAAIERELEREGQVYYVHNRIQSIFHVAEHIRQLVPHAKIVIGHGQMGDEELESAMLDFMHGRANVLLSTTIIENGLDLPNVNTIIVDRAELLGLSQMYQLRGRVGRSMRQAYAYFFSGSRGKIGAPAEERFAAIGELTDLGSGFKVAMRDLEIRGAGDLLGVKQSGGIASVGFEMYTEMLSDAVHRLKREPKRQKETLPEVDLPLPAFLPDDYVESERDRLVLYRKMASVLSLEDAQYVQDELRDRFGPLPAPAMNLIRVLKIRVALLRARLRGISKGESEVLIRLQPGDRFADGDTAAVYATLSKSFDKRLLQNTISLRPQDGIAFDSRVPRDSQLLRMIEVACSALAEEREKRFGGGA